MVRDNIDLFSFTEILTRVNVNATLQVNSISGAKKKQGRVKVIY